MKIEMLANRSGYRQGIREVRDEWIDEILNYLGVDTEIFDEAGGDQSILLEYLMHHKIEILDYPSVEAIEIRFEGEVVGEWAGPDFILIRDDDGELYYKISIETWSILEEDIDLEG